jgi:Tol biopolymer transport system component
MRGKGIMGRRLGVAMIAVAVLASIPAGPVEAKAPGTNGRILFSRMVLDLSEHRVEVFKNYVYTANPDGTDVQQLTPNPLCTADLPRGKCTAEYGRWSPDGSEVLILADVCGALNCSAFIVNPDTGVARTLPQTDATRPVHCAAWSPDGSRLACTLDPFDSDLDPSLAGIYTVRSTDGGGLKRITDFLAFPADYSPDGRWLVIQTVDENEVNHLSVVKLDGTGLKQVTPPQFGVNPGVGVSWSPDGSTILFSGGFVDSGHRGALYTVKPDGTGMHKLSIPGFRCGGLLEDPTSHGCLRPAWSPDGTKIIFDARSTKNREVYTANADGTGLAEVTRTGFGLDDMSPDWGPHPPSA